MSAIWDGMGIGAVAVDDLYYVDHYPLPGGKVPVQREERQGGGLVATALVAASRLGSRVAYAGVLGNDELSRFTLQELEREGIDCTPVIRRANARPIHSTIIVERPTGQRSILFSFAGVQQLHPCEISENLIAGCRVLLIDHTVDAGGLRAIDLAHNQGIPVIGDIEHPGGPWITELLASIDHLIIGITLARHLTGLREPEATVRALSEPRRACLVVTVGEQGCWYAERDGPVHHFPAFEVSVVDTTGCGDVFHGAYAWCLAQGADVTRCIEVATAAAAIKATRSGGRSGIPHREMLDRFLKQQRRG